MQLKLTFSALLAVLLVSVEASPVAKRNTHGIITLPLHRVQRDNNVHPIVKLQQHINRSNRRLARMTGRAEPDQHEMVTSIQKRLVSIDDTDVLEKRYNRHGAKTQGVKGLKLVGPSVEEAAGTAKAATSQTLPGSRAKQSAAAAAGSAGSTLAAQQAGQTVGDNSRVAGSRVKQSASAGGAAGSATAAQQAGQIAGKKSKANNAATAIPGGATANPGVSQVQTDAVAQNKVTAAGPPSVGDSIGLDIESNDVGYLARVQMGTPPRNFELLMDSGSADLWVGAENCQSQAGGNCGNHNFLGPASSNTFKDTQKPFQVTYGTGEVQGSIVTDDISVAGLPLQAHTFGVATTESVDFSDNSTPFDGIMGLAQSTLSQQNTATPIEALVKTGALKQTVVSYKISRLADLKNDGEITFGGLDATKFDPLTLTEVPNVSQQGFWEASMPAVSVDGTDLGLKGRTAILDTGTTLIIAPAADALAIHQQIAGAQSDGQGGFVIPCTTTASVALTFGQTSFAIDPRDLAFAPLDPNDPTGDCVSGISSGNIGGANEWLVGDVFLKNAYFSTNVDRNTLSLAKLV
ncbi:acid protease [Pleurotus eryngii]|uniref:Acid protease n=1 Tax=Pleurotus eryngii TaxID=5323 RepID=A0A9P6DCX6_PLEER|nr:acid protease [Pleurotus eryngii]